MLSNLKAIRCILAKLLFVGALCVSGVVYPAPVLTIRVSAEEQAGHLQLYLPTISQTAPAVEDAQPFPLQEPENPLPTLPPDEIEMSVARGISYYVDCNAGNDGWSGTSQEQAWKTLDRANKATLAPGDRLFLKRGCIWTGQLQAKWQGTPDQPIWISAYGTGDLPIIQDAGNGAVYNIKITGSYQIIESISTRLTTRPHPDPTCQNQPVLWFAGFGFVQGAHHNTVRRSLASQLAIGIFFEVTSHHNRALNNTLRDNDIVWVLNSNDTIGAMGVLLHGDANEVAYNYFANNRAHCTYTGAVESNSVELYQATNALIHHNVAYLDRVFSELGSSATVRSDHNTFAYNLHVTNVADLVGNQGGRFVVTRGWGDPHGPVLHTTLYNNTVYLTGANSTGVSCLKCGPEILTLQNNILYANRTPFYTDAPFGESHNLFWNGVTPPSLYFVGFAMSASSQTADPLFADPAHNNFVPRLGSPAVDRGTPKVPGKFYRRDLHNTVVPTGASNDIGAYEYK